MTKLRLVLLATTALTAMHFANVAAHAQTAPLVVAQAQTDAEKEKKGPPPKGAPPPAAPAQAAPANPPSAPTTAVAPPAQPAPPPASNNAAPWPMPR